MKDYAKEFSDINIDISNFITEYNIVDNGIYITYIDRPTKFISANDETECYELVEKIEEIMKLQAITLFNTLYDNNQEALLQDMKTDKKIINKTLMYPLTILVLSIILAFSLLYVKDLSTLALIIISNLIARSNAVKAKKINGKLSAKGELAKRINFIQIEDELNTAINRDISMILEGTKKNTKLIVISNSLNNLPSITMNDISEISLKDLNKMISNMLDNNKKDNNISSNNDNLSKTKNKDISQTSKKDNHNNYSYKYDLNNSTKNTYKEQPTKSKEKTKIRKKDD